MSATHPAKGTSWKVVKPEHQREWRVATDDGFVIATRLDESSARLIAAAPELAEALKTCAEIFAPIPPLAWMHAYALRTLRRAGVLP